jgi:hypothetical protein
VPYDYYVLAGATKKISGKSWNASVLRFGASIINVLGHFPVVSPLLYEYVVETDLGQKDVI